MIDFACKKFGIDEVIRCSFGLSKSDYKLFTFLLAQDDEMTANEISDAIGLDRTTVQKAIKKLASRQVVIRMQLNLERGGYLYRYRIKDKELLKKNIVTIIQLWAQKAQEEIGNW